jgi:hypothetical protein
MAIQCGSALAFDAHAPCAVGLIIYLSPRVSLKVIEINAPAQRHRKERTFEGWKITLRGTSDNSVEDDVFVLLPETMRHEKWVEGAILSERRARRGEELNIYTPSPASSNSHPGFR